MRSPGSITRIIFLVFTALYIDAQEGAGVYRSAFDFSTHTLFTCGQPSKVKLHDLLNREMVSLRCMDSTIQFIKSDIFGYRDEEGNIFRFFRGETYRIMNPGEDILMYERSFGTGFRGSPVTSIYYFSSNAAAEVMPLTYKNVLTVFEDNPAFELVLELCFSSDEELLLFDGLHKMYKINRLLLLSKSLVLNKER
jgi:hypothetical protein